MIGYSGTDRKNLDQSKLIAGLIYVSKKLIELGTAPDMYFIFKIMYLSDLASLREYNQFIFGGFFRYPDGPVQDILYHEIQRIIFDKDLASSFTVCNEKIIVPFSDPDLDEFSGSDIECMDKVLVEIGSLTKEQISDKVTDSALLNTQVGDLIDINDIARVIGLNDDQVEYLKDTMSNFFEVGI